jgi:hypothetical protein
VTVTDRAGSSATGTGTATVTDGALTLTGGFQVAALQAQSATLTLANFTDGNPSASPSDFTATINWGDNSGTEHGSIAASVDGVFSVQGSHTYSEDGIYTVQVTLTDADGNTATTTSTVAVGEVYAGEASSLTVASFTDSDQNTQASAYTATIYWGDGTESSGTVTGANGVFTVQGSHVYAVDSVDQGGGVYQVLVTITDADGDVLTGNGTVAVVRPPMAGDADEFVGQPGVVLNEVPVAEFMVPDATDGTSEFGATINWGDGTAPSGGMIQEVGPGLFEVLGSHTYAVSGSYSVQVELSQDWSYPWFALTMVGEAVIGQVPTPSISSPRLKVVSDIGPLRGVVVGNSTYTFDADGLTALNINKFDGKVTWQISGPGAADVSADVVVKSQSQKYKKAAGQEVLDESEATLLFKNQPVAVTLTLELNGKPIAKAPTMQVDVVQVNITGGKQVQVTYKSQKFILGKFKQGNPPYLVGTPADAGMRTTSGGMQLKSMASSTNVLLQNTTEKDAVGNQMTTGTFNVNQPGLWWFANVALKAPNDNDYQYVHVGFEQMVAIPKYNGTYDNNSQLVSSLQGHIYLDLANAKQPWPYYQEVANENPDALNKDCVFFNASPGKTSQMIWAQDRPTFDLPSTYEQLTVTQLMKEGVRHNDLNRIDGLSNFTTAIVASTNDKLGLEGTYWGEAVMRWSFNGSGKVELTDAATHTLTWTGTPGVAKVAAPDAWEILTDPSVILLPTVDGKIQIANVEASRYVYFDPKAK